MILFQAYYLLKGQEVDEEPGNSSFKKFLKIRQDFSVHSFVENLGKYLEFSD